MLVRGLILALSAAIAHASHHSNVTAVCDRIAKTISSASAVFYPSSQQYAQDIAHWDGSSTQQSTCSVEPGCAADVSAILKIVGSTRTPFAVKSGGHATNVGFSSTTGVQISMARFNEVNLSADSKTVEIGTGLIWDDVYAALDGKGVNVIGGRVSGVGVGGFVLGGGYSWKTSQYGLTIDNIVSYELVLPTGKITTVTAKNKDLWFALRGGFNNFGIVTKVTLVTHPQTEVWGGTIFATGANFPAMSAAIAAFSKNTDKKAAIIPSYNFAGGNPIASILLFYDAPTPPAGLFDAFVNIPSLSQDIKTRSFASLIASYPGSSATVPARGAFASVSVLEYSLDVVTRIQNLTFEWGPRLSQIDPTAFLSFDVEPFDASLFSHGAPSAYPPDRSRGLLPTNLFFSWTQQSADAVFLGAMKNLTENIREVAVADGQHVQNAATYGNYALGDTPLKRIYGGNVARLRAIHAAYDPQNVMGLAGGFKF